MKERKTAPKSSEDVRLWDLVGKMLENEVDFNNVSKWRETLRRKAFTDICFD